MRKPTHTDPIHTDPRALGLHYAAHAMMVRELGYVIRNVTVDPKSGTGSFTWSRASEQTVIYDELMYRTLVELDALVLLAGSAAERHWFPKPTFGHDDLAEARTVLSTVEANALVLDTWIKYLTERASAILRREYVWRLVSGLGDALQRVPSWDAAAIDQLARMPSFSRSTMHCGEVPQPLPGTPAAMLRNLRDEFKVSPAALATLERVGVTTVWHLIHCSEKQLVGLRHIGRRTMEKLKAQLAERGWSMGMEIPVESSAERPKPPSGRIEDVMHLAPRTLNCLKNANIVTVEQLARWTDSDLARLKNVGCKTREEIITAAANAGITIRRVLRK